MFNLPSPPSNRCLGVGCVASRRCQCTTIDTFTWVPDWRLSTTAPWLPGSVPFNTHLLAEPLKRRAVCLAPSRQSLKIAGVTRPLWGDLGENS